MKFLGFLITFIFLFAFHVVFLAAVDALPEPVRSDIASNGSGPVEEEPTPVIVAPANPEAPVRVVAKDIGMDVTVLNPTSTDIAKLDEELLKGAVRYPTSAKLGVDGTVLLFGHSSYLPIVRNQNYKAFNGIQNLKKGQVVSVYSGGAEYRYKVTGVRLANADEDQVALRSGGKYLTLVTCNTFAAKTARYVVEAELATTHALP